MRYNKNSPTHPALVVNGVKLDSMYIPDGPQPRDFDSWRNYIRNTLLTMQVINNDGMYSFSKYPVSQVASREEIRHKVSDGTGCYNVYRALGLCVKEKPKAEFAGITGIQFSILSWLAKIFA